MMNDANDAAEMTTMMMMTREEGDDEAKVKTLMVDGSFDDGA